MRRERINSSLLLRSVIFVLAFLFIALSIGGLDSGEPLTREGGGSQNLPQSSELLSGKQNQQPSLASSDEKKKGTTTFPEKSGVAAVDSESSAPRNRERDQQQHSTEPMAKSKRRSTMVTSTTPASSSSLAPSETLAKSSQTKIGTTSSIRKKKKSGNNTTSVSHGRRGPLKSLKADGSNPMEKMALENASRVTENDILVRASLSSASSNNGDVDRLGGSTTADDKFLPEDALPPIRPGRKTFSNASDLTCASTVARFGAGFPLVHHLHKTVPRPITLENVITKDEYFMGTFPFCGIYKLFSLTNLVLAVHGPGVGFDADGAPLSSSSPHLVVGKELDFTIEGCVAIDATGGGVDGCPDVYFLSRLIGGPNIIPVHISPNRATERTKFEQMSGISPTANTICSWTGRYTVYEPGNYHLEVRVMFLDGGVQDIPLLVKGLPGQFVKPRPSIPAPTLLAKFHSFPRGRFDSFEFNGACDAQSHLDGSPYPVKFISGARNRDDSNESRGRSPITTTTSSGRAAVLPVCSRGVNWQPEPGRWIRHNNLEKCREEDHLCVGDPLLLNDVKPWNWNYLYAPLNCKFRIWGPASGGPETCSVDSHQSYEKHPISTNFLNGHEKKLDRRGGFLGGRKPSVLMLGDSIMQEYSQAMALIFGTGNIEETMMGGGNNVEEETSGGNGEVAGGEGSSENATIPRNNFAFSSFRFAAWIIQIPWFQYELVEKVMSQLVDELIADPPSVLIMNGSPLHIIPLNQLNFEWYISTLAKHLRRFVDTHYVGSTPNSTNWTRRLIFVGMYSISFAEGIMTPQRLQAWENTFVETLTPLGFEHFSTWNTTMPRYDASWDGVHRSAYHLWPSMEKLGRANQTHLYTWNGGVVQMLAAMLLNLICAATP